MHQEQISRVGKLVFATFANTSSFPSKVPTTTEPTNDGVYDLLVGLANLVPPHHKVWPLGLGANDDAFSMRVLGWHSIGYLMPGGPGILWWPTVICEVACILGTSVGVAGTPVLSTVAFCDTITMVTQGGRIGTDGVNSTQLGNIEITSPGGDLIGYIIIPTQGFQKLEFVFDQTTNTPTSNVIISGL